MQVQARAMEVWGDEEKLEEAREQRIIKNEKAKKKKFDKRIKGIFQIQNEMLKQATNILA